MVCPARYQRQGEQGRGVYQQCSGIKFALPRVRVASAYPARESSDSQKRQAYREGA